MLIHSLLTFWLKPISLSVRKEMPLSQKKKIYITNTASLWLALMGPFFAILNGLNGLHTLMLINVATSSLGATCLFLSWHCFHQTAAILLLTGSSLAFFFSGLLFNNGMEYSLLVSMVGAVFMFDHPWARIPFALGNAIAFFTVKFFHISGFSNAVLPPSRYATNLFVFLFCYYWILEMFRTVNNNYHREVELRNRDLAESRRRLDEDHAALSRLAEDLRTANITKEKLFSLVAHDLRGPVGNLKSIVDMLEGSSLAQEDFQRIVPSLKGEIDHTYSCLETLLTWSASQLNVLQPVFTSVDLHQVAENCIGLTADMAEKKKITIQNHIFAGTVVWADENQLAAILRNLLSNAVKFTPNGGRILLDAFKEKDEMWRICVTDTGIGIPSDRINHLLAPNNTVTTPGTHNERGLGLGLQICREFVQNHHSELQVESKEGCGTTFAFSLPVASQAVAAIPNSVRR